MTRAPAIAAWGGGYIVPTFPTLRVTGIALSAFDGAALFGEDALHLEAREDAEFGLDDVL